MRDRCFILASGPSMTQEDADKVKGNFTIAVNSTWKLAPWCDVLFAGDRRWWDAYGKEVDIPAVRICNSKTAAPVHRAKLLKRSKVSSKGHNSGLLAIEWAAQKGFKRIYLLGFDCSIKHGIHHHGPHKDTPNPNQTRCNNWKEQFERIKKYYPEAQVINCSRYTELKAFECAALEDVL